jgi:hypothetical protein
LATGVFGHDEQAVDGQQRLAQAQAQALRHGTCRAQAGEGARPVAKGDEIEVGPAQAGGVQQRRALAAAAWRRPPRRLRQPRVIGLRCAQATASRSVDVSNAST